MWILKANTEKATGGKKGQIKGDVLSENSVFVQHNINNTYKSVNFYCCTSVLAHNNSIFFSAMAGNYCSILLQTDLIFANLQIFTSSVFISGLKPRWKSSEVFITGLQFDNEERFGFAIQREWCKTELE